MGRRKARTEEKHNLSFTPQQHRLFLCVVAFANTYLFVGVSLLVCSVVLCWCTCHLVVRVLLVDWTAVRVSRVLSCLFSHAYVIARLFVCLLCQFVLLRFVCLVRLFALCVAAKKAAKKQTNRNQAKPSQQQFLL